MCAENGGIACQVIEVVHDDSHEEIEHEKGTEEDEGDEIKVGDLRAASLVGGQTFARRLIVLVRTGITGAAGLAGQHDTGPSLASCTSEIKFVSFHFANHLDPMTALVSLFSDLLGWLNFYINKILVSLFHYPRNRFVIFYCKLFESLAL